MVDLPAIGARRARLLDHAMAGAAAAQLARVAARNQETAAPFGRRGGFGCMINRRLSPN
jgi:hypothetical protein